MMNGCRQLRVSTGLQIPVCFQKSRDESGAILIIALIFVAILALGLLTVD